MTEVRKNDEAIDEIILNAPEQENIDDDDIPDLEEIKESLLDENVASVFKKEGYFAAEEPEENIVKTRVYDL